jgi:carboxymethylenebutenolidase
VRKGHRQLSLHVYDAGPGFNSDERGSYDAKSATLATQRTLGFFVRHID